MTLVLVSIAGIFGVLARYFLSYLITAAWLSPFPYATVLINVVGSFFIGAIHVAGVERATISETAQLALTVGLLGGFTTFSAFALETIRLIERGSLGLALVNVLASVTCAILACAAGMAVARAAL